MGQSEANSCHAPTSAPPAPRVLAYREEASHSVHRVPEGREGQRCELAITHSRQNIRLVDRLMMNPVAEATESGQLDGLTALLHDELFVLCDMALDAATSILRLPFRKEDRSDLRLKWHHVLASRWVVPLREWVLEVWHARWLKVDDEARIGRYELDALKYDSASRTLEITACAGLRVSVGVDTLRARIFCSGRPAGQRTVFLVLGCEIAGGAECPPLEPCRVG